MSREDDQRAAELETMPDLLAALQASVDRARGRVCPVEDCPWRKDPNAADCGEHEEWMT